MGDNRLVWYLLVDEHGNAYKGTRTTSVNIPPTYNVDQFSKQVYAENPNKLSSCDASDLIVYANKAAFDAKDAEEDAKTEPLLEDIKIDNYGGSRDQALYVVVPDGLRGGLRYFITLEVQDQVEQAVFLIVDDSTNEGVGMGVFFAARRAVSCDHNLNDQHVVGSWLTVQAPGRNETLQLRIVARDPDLDITILESITPQPFIAPWAENPDNLRGTDLVLASFRIGIDEHQPIFSRRLGFTKASSVTVSHGKRHLLYSCPTFAGDSGAALIIEDGRLVGIHQEAINALREKVERKKLVKDRLNDVEESLDALLAGGTSQGSCAILALAFI